jgi:hypothetical protein
VTAPPTPPPTTVDLLVVLTRVETKLDAVTRQGIDHETRLRAIEQSAVTQDDLGSLREDVETLKRGRWPLASVGAVAGVAGTVVGAIAILQQH